MSDLLWPGDDRCGDLFTDAAVLAAMVRVEAAWLEVIHRYGISGPDARDDLRDLVGAADVPDIAQAAEAGGNPVIPLLAVLRDRLRARNPAAADWLHRGLTSQDVLDTALVLCLGDVLTRLRADLAGQIATLTELTDAHRGTPMVARTLTQHAVPITFGLKAAGWLHGVLDAFDLLEAAAGLPAQLGGAAGSLAAPTVLAGSPAAARELVEATAAVLGLPVRDPWHTSRLPFVRFGDALVSCTDAWGRIANDVLLGARPEIHELAEAPVAGRGGSSTMANKRNPVLAVLIRRAALTGPPQAATLHAAAAAMVDERADGAWHVEWPVLRTLARHTVTAGSQTAELLAGLQVDSGRMAVTLAAARPGVDAEQESVGGTGPYPGTTDLIIDAVRKRAGTP